MCYFTPFHLIVCNICAYLLTHSKIRSCVIVSGICSLFVNIKGHAGLISGQDSEKAVVAWKKMGNSAATAATLTVPESEDVEATNEVEKDS